jgi:glycosyltransferase involved in cell wall biosynthesis
MSDKQLNILIVASWYPDESDLSGIFIKDQAELLANSGHNVTVIHPFLTGTFLQTRKKRSTIVNKNIEGDFQLIKIGIAPLLPVFRSISYLKLCMSALQELEKLKINFDLIHSHSVFMGGIVAKFLSKNLSIPYVHTEHASNLISGTADLTIVDQFLLRRVFKDASSVIFVSNFFKGCIIDKYHFNDSDFEVIGNIIHPDFFATPVINRKNKIPKKFLVICNLVQVKGIDFLLDTWAEFIKLKCDSELTIAGEGPLKETLIEKAKQLKIDHTVCWLSKPNRAAVIELIDEHDVILSTSHIETFGMIPAEAQARGRIVLSTDSGGINDILESQTGIISPRVPDIFAKFMLEINQSEDFLNPVEISEKCKSKYSKKIILGKLNSLYQKALLC